MSRRNLFPSLASKLLAVALLIAEVALAAEGSAERWIQRLPNPDLAGLESAVAQQLQTVRQDILTAHERQPLSAEEAGEALGLLGQHYHAYEMNLSARECYELARSEMPEDFRWPYLLAYLAQREGLLENAAQLYKDALLVDPKVAPAWMRLGEVELGRDDPGAAERAFRRSIQMNDVAAAGRAGLGKSLAAQGHFREAAKAFEVALTLAPEANRLYYTLAQTYRELGESEKSEQAFSLSGRIGVRPDDPLIDGLSNLKTGERAFLLSGRMAFNAGDYPAAATAFERATQADPQSIRAKINLAAALEPLGETARAREILQETVELAPGNETAWFNLGQLLVKEGELEGAIEAFLQANSYGPNDPEIVFALAETLYATGDLERALKAYRRMLELSPATTQAHLGVAQTLIDMADYPAALGALVKGTNALPTSGSLTHALARFLAANPDPDLRDGDQATMLALGVYQTRPTWRHGETVALALAETGECVEAAKWLTDLMKRHEVPAEEVDNLSSLQEKYSRGAPCNGS